MQTKAGFLTISCITWLGLWYSPPCCVFYWQYQCWNSAGGSAPIVQVNILQSVILHFNWQVLFWMVKMCLMFLNRHSKWPILWYDWKGEFSYSEQIFPFLGSQGWCKYGMLHMWAFLESLPCPRVPQQWSESVLVVMVFCLHPTSNPPFLSAIPQHLQFNDVMYSDPLYELLKDESSVINLRKDIYPSSTLVPLTGILWTK